MEYIGSVKLKQKSITVLACLYFMIFQTRNGTKQKDIAYALHLFFDGLSLRNTSKALSRFVKRSHSTKREWILKYKP